MTSTDHRPVPTDGPPVRGVSRRSVLRVGAVGVAGVAGLSLAGCTQAPVPDNPTVSSAGRGPAGDSGSSGGTGSPAAGKPLAQLSAIPVGGAVSATGPNGAPLIIARPSSSTVAAFSAICTHQGCTVAPVGNQLDCPCHGSVYNASTGAVINGPAPRPLPSVQVTLSGDNVLPA
ncbi:MAG TPA: Rieske (2Fe-2S) protein [Jatrophihabitans sp.]|nr:Rieske (2Fe-2S) protein [Jatrophihabitans sp.]